MARKVSKLVVNLAVGTAILALVVAIAIGVSLKTSRDLEDTLEAYRAKAHQDTVLTAGAVGGAFDQIYQNLRTISFLASVRRIDRHGENLSVDGRQAIQQIFNNLAANVAVSEVYIVPVDLDPDAIDPQTHDKQVPILMFDLVRLSMDGHEKEDPVDPTMPPQEEGYEYSALRKLMGRLHEVAPRIRDEWGADIPFFSIGSLITCDNSVYNKTRKDADRTGPIFSVPFFGPDGALKGTISAIMRDAAIEALLPAKNYAILDTSTGGVFRSP
jgi:hypothetical protein